MAVDYASYQRLLEYRIPEIRQTLTTRDTMLYALGLGLGADPMDEQQLRFVYEKNLLALPTMAVVLAAPHAWVKKSGTGFASKSVHGEQTLEIHKPLPVEGELIGVPRLARVIDKGADKGALIVTERKVYEKKTGGPRVHARTDELLPGRRRIRRTGRAGTHASCDTSNAAAARVRSADSAAGGAHLQAERRLQPAARRSRACPESRIPAPDTAWPWPHWQP